jgi:hypothetical protein
MSYRPERQREDTMQRWEYKTVRRSRSWDPKNDERPYLTSQDWNVPLDYLEAFGEEGWELVSVVPMSSYLGELRLPSRSHPAGKVDTQIAGYTTEQLWVFKRPKP